MRLHSTVRDELQDELDRIRTNRMGFFYSGFLWGIVIGAILMAIFAVAYTLPFYGILPEYSLPGWIGTERFLIAMFSIPLVSSLVWTIWAIARVSYLKGRIRKLQPVEAIEQP